MARNQSNRLLKVLENQARVQELNISAEKKAEKQAAKDELAKIVERLEKEYKRRALLLDFFDEQKKVLSLINKPNCRVAVIAPRRYSKTYIAIAYAIHLCSTTPNISVRYLTTYRTAAKDIAWPIILELLEKYGIRTRTINNQELEIWFPNASRLRLYGADQENFRLKFRGTKSAFIVIDEAQLFQDSEFENFIQQVLQPSLADLRGGLLLLGTPADTPTGFFYQVTQERDKHPDWVVHEGTPFSNPHTAPQLLAQLETYKQQNPLIEQEPWVQREYFARWAIDNRLTILPFTDSHVTRGHISSHPKEDSYILGIDLGYSPDPTAFILCKYNTYESELRIVTGQQIYEPTLDGVAEVIKAYESKYPNITIVVDAGGLGKWIGAELRNKYSLPIIEAKKYDKRAAINTLYTDVTLNNITFLDPEIEPYKAIKETTWTDINKTDIASGKLGDHYFHALLYSHRYWTSHHRTLPVPVRPSEEERMLETIREQYGLYED